MKTNDTIGLRKLNDYQVLTFHTNWWTNYLDRPLPEGTNKSFYFDDPTRPKNWWTNFAVESFSPPETNWLTITNYLKVGNIYVVPVTPEQWKEMTNTYPQHVKTKTFHFHRP